jgi:hypothetical protein
MAHELLLTRLAAFEGKRLMRYFDEISEIAKARGLTKINVMDPTFNPTEIDVETDRLNIRTDDNGRIVSFSIG